MDEAEIGNHGAVRVGDVDHDPAAGDRHGAREHGQVAELFLGRLVGRFVLLGRRAERLQLQLEQESSTRGLMLLLHLPSR